MPTRHGLDTHAPDALMPEQIAGIIDRLAIRIKADRNADLYAPWAIATLASRLEITIALSASTNPVEIVADLGEAWADHLMTALAEHPFEKAAVLRAAIATMHRLVDPGRRRAA